MPAHCLQFPKLNILEEFTIYWFLGSAFNDFNNQTWQMGREYNKRLINDIEFGFKNWESLDKSIDPTCRTFVRECVHLKIWTVHLLIYQTQMHILNHEEFIHIMCQNENHFHLDFLSFDKSYIILDTCFIRAKQV